MDTMVLMEGDRQHHSAYGSFHSSDQMSYRFPDTQEGHYRVPITQGVTNGVVFRHRDDPEPDWRSRPYHFVPVLLRRLLPNGCTDHLRNGCWLYVFRNGYLWREIQTPLRYAGGQMMDVNLARHYGQEQRPATCPGAADVLFATRIGDIQPEYRLIFSEVQWNWSQIEACGGLHPQDPRNPQASDLQTAQTLEHLAQRSCLLQFDESRLGRVWVEQLHGAAQPDYPPPPAVDPVLNPTPIAYLADPLQDVRDLKAVHNEALGLLAHCLESRQQGPMALAELIESLIGSDDPQNLEDHLHVERFDQKILTATRNLEDQLPDRILAAETALLDYLQTHQQPLQLALSDYFQGDLDRQELGLFHHHQLLDDLALPESLDWLYTQLNQPAASGSIWALSQAQDQALLQRLRERQQQEAPTISVDNPLLQGLTPADQIATATLLSGLLIQLVEQHQLVLTHHFKGDSAGLLTQVKSRFTELTGVALRKVAGTLHQWLPVPLTRAAGEGYRYLPTGLMQQLYNRLGKDLDYLIPTGYNNLKDFLRAIDTTSQGNIRMLAIFGPLLTLNAGLAISAASKDNVSTTEQLEQYAAIAALLKFISERLQRIYPVLNVRQSQIVHTAVTGRTASIVAPKYWSVLIGAIRFLFKLINIVAVVAESALSGWHLLRGYRTGNTGVMVTSGIILVATLLGVVALTLSLPLLFWVSVLAGLGAALLRPFLEYSPLEAAVRFGWLGRTPYPDDSQRPFNRPANLHPTEWQNHRRDYIQVLEQLGAGRPLFKPEALGYQPDVSEELKAITSILYRFKAQLNLLRLVDYQGDLAPTPVRPSQMLLELEVQLGQFIPLNSLLRGRLEVGGMSYTLDKTWIVEEIAEGAAVPSSIRCYLPVEGHVALQNISAQLWLDTGDQWVPCLPDESGLRVQWNKGIYPFLQQEWAEIRENARYVPMTEAARVCRLYTDEALVTADPYQTQIPVLFGACVGVN